MSQQYKADDIRVEVINVNYQMNKVELGLIDSIDINELNKRLYNGKSFAYLSLYNQHSITDMQRKHFFALVGDIADYTGYPSEAVSDYIKYQFMTENDLEEFPSLRRNHMTKATASKLLEFIISFCVNNEIPFRKQQFYLTTDTSKMLFALTMKRQCVVCGEPHADLHHVNAIGMGRDRRNIDHTEHEYMALCRVHHTETHQIGAKAFMKKYVVQPVKLTAEQLKELGVMK